MLKRFAMFLRSSIKLIVLIVASIILITAAITIFYKPTYEVSLNGELIGYTSDKSNLQERINKYVESGNGDDVVFAQIDSMPKYKLCLLKKDVQTNDDEIYTKVTSNGTEYYRFYAITDNKEEKYYVSTFKEAEDIVKKLKDKDSANKNDIGILEKYDKTKKELTDVAELIEGHEAEIAEVLKEFSLLYLMRLADELGEMTKSSSGNGPFQVLKGLVYEEIARRGGSGGMA